MTCGHCGGAPFGVCFCIPEIAPYRFISIAVKVIIWAGPERTGLKLTQTDKQGCAGHRWRYGR